MGYELPEKRYTFDFADVELLENQILVDSQVKSKHLEKSYGDLLDNMSKEASDLIKNIFQNQEIPEIFYVKEKNGKIKEPNYGNSRILVEGLAQSKKGAESLVGKVLENPSGKIEGTFGNKGVVIVALSEQRTNLRNGVIPLNVGSKVSLKLLRKTQLRKEKSY